MYVNGSEIPVHPTPDGRASIDFPAGGYSAVFKLEHAPIETDGRIISLVTLIGIVGVGGYSSLKDRKKSRKSLAENT